MSFIKRFAVICCIMSVVLVMNGCSEGSTSFEHTSSVEVSTSSGINFSSSYSETKSSAIEPFTFKINDANILDGKVEIYTSITNNGKRDTTLKEMSITFVANDSNGKEITNGTIHYDNISVSLPQNTEIYQLFVIENPEYKRYDDGFNINCNFDNIKVDPDIL